VISVVIPALNEVKLLPGLLAQLTPELVAAHDLELIVSDGGSSDATRDIALAAGCTVVEHLDQRRQTIAEGRNAGAAAARGELLVFLNGDVRLDDADRFFSTITATMREAAVSGATCEVQVFPEEEKGIDRAFHNGHNLYVRFLNAIGEGMGRGECQVLRRSLFVLIGGYNPAMAAGEDYDLFRRVRKHGRIVMLPGVVVYESPRRFRRYGYTGIVWGWTKNALAVIFRNKSSSATWEAVR
jgi:glycosyltransferase involved in cell wall biosynthesis